MASITTTDLVDDLDGSRAAITIALTVDSKRYQIDLSRANYNEYIAPLVKAARPSRVGRPPISRVRRGSRPVRKLTAATTAYSKLSPADQTAIRERLKRTRGRVADSEVTAWKSAGKP